MQPRDRLSAKEIQVATLVWQGLTNKDIAAVLRTSEQVVKNYLRTTFDKLGVWTRLELAMYVAGHGGANWHSQLRAANAPTQAWTADAGTTTGPVAPPVGTVNIAEPSGQRLVTGPSAKAAAMSAGGNP